MRFVLSLTLIIFSSLSFAVKGKDLSSVFQQFENLYQQQLGSTQSCQQTAKNQFKVCSKALRNDGNAPYILHHNQATEKAVVLFHGLSDSPFYLRSVAQSLHQQGFNVVVPLSPGHGKNQADWDMQDPNLADRWRSHVRDIMSLANDLAAKHYIGGFSTGGALAVEYSLLNPMAVQGVILFSGALQLPESAESLAGIWGVPWLAKIIDGRYQADNPNPFKYPHVARFAALELLEVIFSIRQLMAEKEINLPIFAAHSEADNTTLLSGVENLMAQNTGTNRLFVIPKELDVCHADVVINQQQIEEIGIHTTDNVDIVPCDEPKANPQHGAMLEALQQFLQVH